MATSHLDNNITATAAPTLATEEAEPSLSEAMPATAAADTADTSSVHTAPASQAPDSAEAAQTPITSAGPPTTEHDPAPLQPPIQPVSILCTHNHVTQNVSLLEVFLRV